jgi:hypothetical protein
MQAACLRPERRSVVDSRIALKRSRGASRRSRKNRKAAVPAASWRVGGTPPGSKSGACIQRGHSGTWESHSVSLCPIRRRRAVQWGKTPGAQRRLAPRRRTVWENTRDTKPDEEHKVSGKDRAHRTTPRGAMGSLSGSAYRGPGAVGCGPGRWGPDVPRDPLEGRGRRASRLSGGTSGRDAGLTNHIHETPETCTPRTALASDGVQQRLARDRPRLSAGSLAPHSSEPGARGG